MEELYKINSTSEKILNKENIIFEHEDQIKGIESIFCFKNGDILIFKNTFSVLYDGKTLKEKLQLKFLGALCAFCYLSEDEFILLKDSYLSLYRFSNNRTKAEEICLIHEDYINKNKNIFVLSNNDLINITQVCLEPKEFRIFRRIEENNKLVKYELITDILEDIKDIDYVVNLEEDEFLTMKRDLSNEEVLLKVYSNENYLIKRFNRIKCILNGKRMIYYSMLPVYKMKKKIIIPSVCLLNIIDIYTLELETSIKISEEIKDIKILDNDFIIIFECFRNFENYQRNFLFYLTKVLIDFDMNDMVKIERNKINDEAGEFMSLFKIFNYRGNGLATITDQNYLKIYNKV